MSISSEPGELKFLHQSLGWNFIKRWGMYLKITSEELIVRAFIAWKNSIPTVINRWEHYFEIQIMTNLVSEKMR